jgi:multidrug efflux pump
LVNVQLPPGATLERTRRIQVEGFMLKQPEVEGTVALAGFSGQNAGLARDAQ